MPGAANAGLLPAGFNDGGIADITAEYSSVYWTLTGLPAIARTARTVGDWELAGRVARQMIEHDPSYGGSHYALGLVADHDEDRATAKTELALAQKYWAKADADFPELAEIKKRLR